MENPEVVYLYSDKALTISPTSPDWLEAAIEEDAKAGSCGEGLAISLSYLDGLMVESYGDFNEFLHVWRIPGRGWLVDYMDVADRVMFVLIQNTLDFIRFQAEWIAPMATKITLGDVTRREREELQAEEDREMAAVEAATISKLSNVH